MSYQKMVPSNCQLGRVSTNLWVGNAHACNRESSRFERVVHIYHPSQGNQCAVWTAEPGPWGEGVTQTPGNLFLEYKEHDLPTEEQLVALTAFCQEDVPTLIHCDAGMGRSTTLALLAYTVQERQGDPDELLTAMCLVAQATWMGYRHRVVPHYDRKVIEYLLQFLEASDELLS